MKSKASLFNWTLFCKDITRFFPVWAVYTAIWMISFNNLGNLGTAFVASGIADWISGSALVSAFYAPLVCMLLFGDLYQKRICNGIHAMPVSRTTLFFSHTAAALCFYIVPNTLVALVQLVYLGRYWYISFYWLLGTTLIYICFLGISLLCAFCTGKRFAMAVSYILVLNFSSIVYALFTSLYQPLLYGIRIREDIFSVLSPVASLGDPLYVNVFLEGLGSRWTASVQIVSSDWLIMCIWAAVGIAAGAAALLLYRRRHLESAGSLITVKFLRPVFLVLYVLLFVMAFRIFDSIPAMLISLILGYFTGLMLLNRSRHVFSGKAWAGLGLFVGVIALSLVLTAVDVLGVTRWVPKPEDVKLVRLSSSSYIEYLVAEPFYMDDEVVTLRDPQDISNAISLHKFAKGDGRSSGGKTIAFSIEYTLNNGDVRRRYYDIPVHSPEGQLYAQYLSRPEVLFGKDPEGFLAQASVTELNGHSLTPQEQETVKQMLLADCEAGYMAQDYAFRGSSSSFRLTLKQGNLTVMIQVYDLRSSLYQWIVQNGYSWRPLK